MTIYYKTSNNIHVAVEPTYEAERSQPENSLFVFSYKVSIRNDGDVTVQINKRSWVITDAYFNTEYVEGDGVIGETPLILPGETYSYVSYCPIKTTFGTMRGHYLAVDDKGKNIKIDIPEFTLAHPFAVQ